MQGELKEFVGATREEAAQLAARHFGVPVERLALHYPSETLDIYGLRGRVLAVASVSEEQGPVGPAGEFLLGLLERMHLPGRVRVGEVATEEQIRLSLFGDSVRELGRDDRVLDALSHLVERVAQRRVGPDVVVKVEAPSQAPGGGEDRSRGEDAGRRRGREEGRFRGRSEERRGRGDERRGRGEERRGRGDERRGRGEERRGRGEERRGRGEERAEEPGDERLESLARDRAAEVVRSGQAVELPPMGSRERWVVHNALKEHGGIRTESVGEGREKRVRIIPA